MGYPWPSLGGFMFKRGEHAIYGTDNGWVLSPAYNRQRPLGTSNDVITTLSIGSYERSFEVYLTPDRYASLEMMLNTQAVFTDWTRPIPDSRGAFLSEIQPVEEAMGMSRPQNIPGNTNGSQGMYRTIRRRRVRITLIST